MTRNARTRFLDNNFNDTTVATVTYSGQLSATYAASNTRDSMRSKVWKPAGNFTIRTSNAKVYINDGTSKTGTLTAANYATGTALATHVQAVLNAISSGWTASYSTTTYKFTISRSSSATLSLGTTTDAVWDTLGFTATADDASGPWPADEARIHTSEWYQVDLGLAYECPAFCAIGPIDEAFTLSTTATIRVKADNVDNNWDSPALNELVTATDAGIFAFLDNDAGTSRTYRYWRFEFIDRLNPGGPSVFKFSHLYFGDYVTMDLSNVATGFSWSNVDQTQVDESESGQQFFKEGIKYRRFQSMSIEMMDADERRDFTRMFQRLGLNNPFYLSLDPTLAISETTAELTAFGRFASEPSLSHVIRDYFTVNFDFREAC